jgi:hypothetical protein
MRILLLWCSLWATPALYAQELFVFTEPASNMPAKSFGIRTMNSFMQEANKSINYHNMPELMFGVNKNLMLHTQAFISNRQGGGITFEGGSLYGKYRFYSVDDAYTHFRLAAYGRYSINRADIHQQEIETMAHNSGYEIGTIATKLLHKWAFNGIVSYERALDNKPNYKFPINESNNAINYSLSIGKLVLPKEYTSYKQTNMNIMVEFLGQQLLQKKLSYLDIAPSIQFIINSQARIDVAYRRELLSSMRRTAPNGFIVKLEYTFFNILK